MLGFLGQSVVMGFKERDLKFSLVENG